MNKKIIVTLLVAVVAGAFAVVACSKDNQKKVVKKEIRSKKGNWIKPERGFLAETFDEETNSSIVIMGQDPDLFFKTTWYKDDELVDYANVLYSFEDLDEIVVSRITPEEFDMTIYGETCHLCDFRDVDGGFSYTIINPDGEKTYATLYYEGITAKEYLEFICNLEKIIDEIPNSAKSDCIKIPWGKIGKAVFKKVPITAIVITAIEIWNNHSDRECQNQREADKFNCDKQNKCIEANGECHYRCIDCPK